VPVLLMLRHIGNNRATELFGVFTILRSIVPRAWWIFFAWLPAVVTRRCQSTPWNQTVDGVAISPA
jgi:hypothetical protein